ncbi:tRNA-specific adenosine deaminase [Clostridia bacterium]|nr:tRNA-specific adenosine deaminase [Clostridia bacterium]
MKNYEKFMRIALSEAKKSLLESEVPIGAAITQNNELISVGHNKREASKNSLFHAEILAIKRACRTLKNWRLSNCEIYVTLEPCPMCAGAIINSRIKKVIFGAFDKKSGACGSVVNLFEYPLNHKPAVISGILNFECSEILSKFFEKLRNLR